jgi:hypothetical protein
VEPGRGTGLDATTVTERLLQELHPLTDVDPVVVMGRLELCPVAGVVDRCRLLDIAAGDRQQALQHGRGDGALQRHVHVELREPARRRV